MKYLLESIRQIAATQPGQPLYDRILDQLAQFVRFDAAAISRFSNNSLHVLASRGLSPQVDGMCFDPADHPRLARILESEGLTLFADDDPTPDPYDGLLEGFVDGRTPVHSCMGCALRVEGELVGVLTFDSHQPGAFDDVNREHIELFAALAATSMRMSGMYTALQAHCERNERVVQELVRDALLREGGEIMGASLPMVKLRNEVVAVAQSGVPALILGETGTGKELVARMLHSESPRADRPLVHVNCAALPESLAESELFGYVRGAFTGATNPRRGKFELADGGTLFLDEIGELPLTLQPKLLRALQEGELQRLGADQSIRVDVRIIAATNRDLELEVEEGRFRADLYHRLSVYPVVVPPLRVRGDDVVLLASAFLTRARARLGIRQAVWTDAALAALSAHDWPGNVRELQHVVLRAAIRANAERGRPDGLVAVDARHTGLSQFQRAGGGTEGATEGASETQADEGAAAETAAPAVISAKIDPTAPIDLRAHLESYERRLVQRALKVSEGNWALAARQLGVDRSNLHRIGKRLQLK